MIDRQFQLITFFCNWQYLQDALLLKMLIFYYLNEMHNHEKQTNYANDLFLY